MADLTVLELIHKLTESSRRIGNMKVKFIFYDNTGKVYFRDTKLSHIAVDQVYNDEPELLIVSEEVVK